VAAVDSFRGRSQAEASSFADQPWWQVFDDLALKALIDEALAHNFDARLATQRVLEYQARAGIEAASRWPTLTASAGWTRGLSSPYTAGGGGEGQTTNVSLGVAWDLDLWGRLRRLNEAARAQYLGTQEARRGVFLATAAQVAQAYFQLRDLDARLAIAQSTTQAFQETRDLFSQRLAGGTASALETSRADAALAGVAATIPDLERQIQAQENLICLLVGRTPGPIARGGNLADQPLPPQIPAGLPSSLLERRPDLRAAEQQIVAANAAVGVAQANYFPTLSLSALAGGVAPGISQLFGRGKEWNVNPELTLPLQGRKLKFQKAAAIAQWEEAKVQYEAAVTGAFGEVSTLLVAYQKLAEAEVQQARSVAAYQEAVHLASLRYSAGLSSYMEVLEAQQQLFPAQNTWSQVRTSRLVALVQLYKALGGGWNLKDPGQDGWQEPR
jgi:multidrug efflux system outer membrane protein